MITLRLRISGLVQGVGYRAYCAREAQRLKINGYVRNMNDGSVEVLCQGDDLNLNEFEEALYKGPRFSRVENVKMLPNERPFVGNGFKIRYDDSAY